MNWKGFGRKRPRFNSDTIPALFRKDYGKPRKILVTVVGVLGEIGTEHLPNTSVGC
jgi:hypothetical protein